MEKSINDYETDDFFDIPGVDGRFGIRLFPVKKTNPER